jgi:hypothetical protein
MTAAGRIRQGVRALAAWATPVDHALAAAYLTPALMDVFRAMRRGEQLHSLNVLRALRAGGHDDPALMTAALLHDQGKCRAPFPVWERTLVVLCKKFIPAAAKRWGARPGDEDAPPRGWRRPFVISAQHPRWSAQAVQAAGAAPLAVALIAAHQTRLGRAPQDDMERLLVALQAADDVS